MVGRIETHSPFLVMGTGRSGTSTVARILHTKLHVSMGDELNPPDAGNPDGYYEDLDFLLMNKCLTTDQINFSTFAVETEKLICKRNANDRLWGFKDNRLCFLLGFYYSLLNDPKIIVCERDLNLTLDSMKRTWGRDYSTGKEICRIKILSRKRILKDRDHLIIRFGKERKPDVDIINEIKNKWGHVWE